MDDRSELVALLEAALFGDGRRLTGDEIAAEARIDRELIRRLRRAMGLPDVPDGEAAYTEQDLEAAKRAGELMREWDLDPSDLLYLSRTLGLAAARMADSIVSFWVDRMARDPRSVPTRGDLVPNLDRQVLYLLHRHLLDAASRYFSFSEPGEAGTAMAVGFADLVGFTALSRELPDSEVAAMIERFEATATDLVVSRDGRVVKMIGDEVMFSAHPEAAGDIALALAECFKSPELPPVRVGLAYGDVVARAGDLFGPVVNLAARATALARPGTVLVAPALAKILEQDGRYALRRLRPRRLKGIGIVQLSVLERADTGRLRGDGRGHKLRLGNLEEAVLPAAEAQAEEARRAGGATSSASRRSRARLPRP